jgi:WD40 repeat protein
MGLEVAVAGQNGCIMIFDKNTGAQRLCINDAHPRGAYRVRYAPDGKTIASSGDAWDERPIHFWDAETGDHILSIEGHQQRPDDIAFSPDGTRIFSVARNEPPVIWDVRTGRLICTLPCEPISFGVLRISPDGRYMAAGGAGDQGQDGRLLLWEVPEYDR